MARLKHTFSVMNVCFSSSFDLSAALTNPRVLNRNVKPSDQKGKSVSQINVSAVVKNGQMYHSRT